MFSCVFLLSRWWSSSTHLGHSTNATCNRRSNSRLHSCGRDKPNSMVVYTARLDINMLQQLHGDSSRINWTTICISHHRYHQVSFVQWERQHDVVEGGGYRKVSLGIQRAAARQLYCAWSWANSSMFCIHFLTLYHAGITIRLSFGVLPISLTTFSVSFGLFEIILRFYYVNVVFALTFHF